MGEGVFWKRLLCEDDVGGDEKASGHLDAILHLPGWTAGFFSTAPITCHGGCSKKLFLQSRALGFEEVYETDA